MTEKGYRQRRACALVGIDPRVYRRGSKRPEDTALRARLKELSSERRRFGYPACISCLAGMTPREYTNRSQEDQNLNRANL